MSNSYKINKAKSLLFDQFRFLFPTNFQRLYPFTTEKISGYIGEFDLQDKSLLTVGSSGDQAINAALKGCKDITVVDTNEFAKEYFYFKKAAILSLTREELLQFLCYLNYPLRGMKNSSCFFNAFMDKVLETLSEEDDESYLFWVSLFREQSPEKIRKSLFLTDEDSALTLPKKNNYLESKKAYSETQEIIEDIHPDFVIGDLRKVSFDRKFDNIFLSNVFDYMTGKKGKKILDTILPYLNEDGKILLYYLYSTDLFGEYKPLGQIYDPSEVVKYFPRNSKIIHFPGVSSMEYKDKSIDGAIIYQKKK